ncbi:MAG: SPASM domain-containing protein, partial [Lachnospiraceae bacterium]|nr:SPASM domain-containing protein [Lachnospiraceae bacterium]
HRFVGIPEFCVGNIYEKQEKETEQCQHVNDRYKCSVCWLKNLCGGGCAYENYVENGSINIASADFCHHMELLYSAIIEIFIEKYYINVK